MSRASTPAASPSSSVRCPLCGQQVQGRHDDCKMLNSRIAGTEKPPARAVNAAHSRGDLCSWETDGDLVWATPGRLELFMGAAWIGYITRLEVTPEGSRAILTTPSDEYCERRWVTGVIPKQLDVSQVAKLATSAGIPHNLSGMSDEGNDTSSGEGRAGVNRSQSPSFSRIVDLPGVIPDEDYGSPSNTSGVSSPRTTCSAEPPKSKRTRRPKLSLFLDTFRGKPKKEKDRDKDSFTSSPGSMQSLKSDDGGVRLPERALPPPLYEVAALRQQEDRCISFQNKVEIALCKARRLERLVNGDWQSALVKAGVSFSGSRTVVWTTPSGSTVEDKIPAGCYRDVMEKLLKLADKSLLESDLRSILYPETGEQEIFEQDKEPDITTLMQTECDPIALIGASTYWPLREEEQPSPRNRGELPPGCCICLDATRNVVFFPCRHLCVCKECSLKLHDCPLCRIKISHRVEIWT